MIPELDRAAIAARAPDLARLGRRLLDGGYTPAALREGLGLPAYAPLLDAARWQTSAETPPLVRLLLAGEEVLEAEVPGTELLLELGLIERRGDALRARLALAPLDRTVILAADRADASGEEWAVALPDASSDFLLHAAPEGGGAWLDIGAGCGTLALHAARAGAAPVIAADLNPRAAAFIELGAALSGLAGRVEALTSDLMAQVPRRTYDVITFNAPILTRPEPGPRWLHAPEGTALLDRFLAELPAFLGDEALLHVELPFGDGPLFERLPPAAHALRALSVRFLVDEDRTYGLLWLARPRLHAWAAEWHVQLSATEPFLERSGLEEEIAEIEARLGV